MLSVSKFKALQALLTAYDDLLLSKIEAQAALKLTRAYEKGFAKKFGSASLSSEDAKRVLAAVNAMANTRVDWQLQFLDRQRQLQAVRRDLESATKENEIWLGRIQVGGEREDAASRGLTENRPDRGMSSHSARGATIRSQAGGESKPNASAPKQTGKKQEQPFPTFPVRRVVPLPDCDYYSFLLSVIRNASWRVWASIFIVDVRKDEQGRSPARQVIEALASVKRNGVDVRLLFGDSHSTPGIRLMNMVARSYARQLGIRTRRHTGGGKSSTHDKFVIVDDECLILGSHNWTSNAFNENYEDSVAVYSEAMCTLKTLEFHRHWAKGVER